MIGDYKYKYIDRNAPSVKINYSYSKYLGLEFIQHWKISRQVILHRFDKQIFKKIIEEETSHEKITGYTFSRKLFSNWLDIIDRNSKEILTDINLLVKRFEVTKKIYSEYNDLMRPQCKDNYLEVENYSLFGRILGERFF